MLRRHYAVLLVLVFFAVVSCALTYPLVRLDRPVLPNVDDSYFNVWRLSWVARQIGRDPLTLFDANIFVPERNTLAYSDAMLALGLVAAPAIHLGLNPVATHNLLMIAAFVAAAVSAFFLCRHLTGSTSAALVGGLIFGFAPYRFAHIAHLELLWTAPMALALLVLHRAVGGARPSRSGLLLGVVVALQAYCSLYYAAFLAIFIGLWAVVAMVMSDAPGRGRLLRCLLVGGVTGVILTAPYGYVYYQAHRELGARDRTEIRRYSATPADYLRVNADNRIYPGEATDKSEERSLFPGIMAMVLAVCALFGRDRRTALGYAVLIALAFDLSLGLNGILYPLFAASLPLMTGLRAPARFSPLFLLCLSVLASLGLHALTGGLSLSVRRTIVGICAGLCLTEYWSAPINTRTPLLTRPAVYQWLRSQPATVIVELPLPTPSTLWNVETTHQYMSLFHSHRLVNGYSGHAPRSYIRTLEIMKGFPSARSIARLRELGVEYVVVHQRFYQAPEFVALLSAMMQSADFDKPLSLPDAADPAFVFPLRKELALSVVEGPRDAGDVSSQLSAFSDIH